MRITQNIDLSMISTEKASAYDGIRGTAFRQPTVVGKNKVVKGFVRRETFNYRVPTE